MTLETLLATCQQNGISICFEQDRLKAVGNPQIVSEMLPMIKQHKEELKAYFLECWQYKFHERAGIIAEDTHNSLSTCADRLAWLETLAEYMQVHYPAIINQFTTLIRSKP